MAVRGRKGLRPGTVQAWKPDTNSRREGINKKKEIRVRYISKERFENKTARPGVESPGKPAEVGLNFGGDRNVSISNCFSSSFFPAGLECESTKRKGLESSRAGTENTRPGNKRLGWSRQKIKECRDKVGFF